MKVIYLIDGGFFGKEFKEFKKDYPESNNNEIKDELKDHADFLVEDDIKSIMYK